MHHYRLRVATYNVHKCRGLDGRTRPARVLGVLRELDADVIALQEVLGGANGAHHGDQGRFFAAELGYYFVLGANRRIRERPYGNLLLSRFPIRPVCNYDLSVDGREPRGCLRADLDLAGGRLLHVFNLHLGTAWRERHVQGGKLASPAVLADERLTGARLVVGDFNDWTRSLAPKLAGARLESADLSLLGRSRTYPGVFPLLHLDHFYFDPALRLESLSLHRSRTALVASDHLPLVADFRLH